MSRVEKLKMKKQNMKKQNMKTTVCGISLSLIIGLTGCIGSYAYLSDVETAKNNLVITLGNVNNEVSKNIKFDNIKPGTSSDEEVFYIENKGSLGQNVKVDYENISNNNYVSKINSKTTYKIEITELNKDESKVGETRVIEKKLNELYDLGYIDLGNLDSGNKLECKVTLNTDKDIPVYNDTRLEFALKVKAEQIKGGK